ncbi:hypothetical protein GGR52DRAFT_151394 [Hypoxylon sp. FL1284]|nr:hypothetical protein GGR52DRAFT_151394 [Hypoxylon sp. FL1284]
MAELHRTGPGSPSFEALQNRTRDMRRSRPPDITILRNENKVPLRPERLAKRESKIGLRNIFGKSKSEKDDKILEETIPARDSSRHGGIRNSLVDIGNWPHILHASHSDVSLPTSPPSMARSSTIVSPPLMFEPCQSSSEVNRGKSRQSAIPKIQSPIVDSFNPPPLFQMYPQAIKHVRLPTCVTPIETLARLSQSRSRSLQRNKLSRSDLNMNQGGTPGSQRIGEGGGRKKSKFGSEWASKIYALVTSGYLLQYAAEGPFDRLPEKVLRLTRDSAAYVTDLIPGKPWVIRVASSTDADGQSSLDNKSLRSKFALRGIEKRQIPDMLLVFQNPEAMDVWLAILRREIESLGGRKKLSETGKLETEDNVLLKTQTSQRTLVVRDPDRFPRIISEDFSWNLDNALADSNEEGDIVDARFERLSGSTMDDGSSLVSADGQRLDSLRDSGSGSGSSGNRLSFISSGQRTVVSSAESSPTTSPIRASFSSYGDDYQDPFSQPPLPPLPEVKPRPNAAAIVNRRQSMQTMIPTFDHRLGSVNRSPPLPPATLPSGHNIKQQFVPNFSVPQTVSRRYSAMNLSAPARAEKTRMLDQDGPIRPPRKAPPTTLAISRPLSIVLDQPSPKSPSIPISPGAKDPAPKALKSPIVFGPRAKSASNLKQQEKSGIPRSLLSRHISDEPNMCGNATEVWSNGQFDTHVIQQDMTIPRLDPDKSYIVRPPRARPSLPAGAPEPVRRTASSLEIRKVSTAPVFRRPSYKRTSSMAEITASHSRHSLIYSKHTSTPSVEEPDYTLSPPRIVSPKRSAPSFEALQQEASPKQLLAVDVGARALSLRRSMPTLAEGPPPAPPPTCALPPLPRKRSTIPRTITA